MNATQKLLCWLAAIALCGAVWYMIMLLPNAMHVETVNQQAVAAGSWKHIPGYQDYKKYTEVNHGY